MKRVGEKGGRENGGGGRRERERSGRVREGRVKGVNKQTEEGGKDERRAGIERWVG